MRRCAGRLEVEMTHNYTACHVCHESLTTACLSVKHGRGGRGQRLSLRGSGGGGGQIKAGPSCTAAPVDSLDAGVAVFEAMSCTVYNLCSLL